MTKQELIYLINHLHPEDQSGEIEATVYDANNGKFKTSSIRLDMDSGRLIVCQENSDNYESNKNNWKTELEFCIKLI